MGPSNLLIAKAYQQSNALFHHKLRRGKNEQMFLYSGTSSRIQFHTLIAARQWQLAALDPTMRLQTQSAKENCERPGVWSTLGLFSTSTSLLRNYPNFLIPFLSLT
jgi:hypothetical protein